MKFLSVIISLFFAVSTAHSAQVGGFSVNDAKPLSEGTNRYAVAKQIRGTRWTGSYTSSNFHFFSRAKGKNKVWEIDSAKKGQALFGEGNEAVRSMLSLFEVDCAEGRLRKLTVELYAGYFSEGKRLGGVSIPEEWSYPLPGTNGEFSLDYGCMLVNMK